MVCCHDSAFEIVAILLTGLRCRLTDIIEPLEKAEFELASMYYLDDGRVRVVDELRLTLS